MEEMQLICKLKLGDRSQIILWFRTMPKDILVHGVVHLRTIRVVNICGELNI